MKKFIILAIFISISSMAVATDIKQARKNLGYELNQTVNILKDYFRKVKTTLEDDISSINSLNSQVDLLVEQSKNIERNYTILPQGRSQIEICKKNEELRWKNSQWICERPKYLSDCKESPGETRIATTSGEFTCQQNGIITENNLGFGVCNNNLGEKYTQVECSFINSKTGQSYQISDKNCYPSKIQRYKQPCGPNGTKSSCKCPTGSSYRYKDGKSQCVHEFNYVQDTTKETIRERHQDWLKVIWYPDNRHEFVLPVKRATVTSLTLYPDEKYCNEYGYLLKNGQGQWWKYRFFWNPDSMWYTLTYNKKESYQPEYVNWVSVRSAYKWEVTDGKIYSKIRDYRVPHSRVKGHLRVYAVWFTNTPTMKWETTSELNSSLATCVEGPATKEFGESSVTADCWKKELVVELPNCKI